MSLSVVTVNGVRYVPETWYERRLHERDALVARIEEALTKSTLDGARDVLTRDHGYR